MVAKIRLLIEKLYNKMSRNNNLNMCFNESEKTLKQEVEQVNVDETSNSYDVSKMIGYLLVSLNKLLFF
ncbi:hypothetical protein HERIO_1576 [Hepatospora eriocheir]|uniref:Uncharacterized protein n=1 Tax=Hepatospora eriocheir TaxID=1081669 RepID=A0A1X0Q9Z1_9MICR|nr:hypothetical protein HERIO_1576 [Hepatospora eriocheir]